MVKDDAARTGAHFGRVPAAPSVKQVAQTGSQTQIAPQTGQPDPQTSVRAVVFNCQHPGSDMTSLHASA